MTVQGERTRDGAPQEGGTSKIGTYIVGEYQGGGCSGQTVNIEAVLARSPGQVEVPAESRIDVSAHNLCKQGTTAIFDITIFSLDTGSCLRMTP